MGRDESTPEAVYSRRSGVDIEWLPATKQFRVVSEMEDGHHRLRLTMVVDKVTSRIREIGAEMPGVPDPICGRAAGLLTELVGKAATPGIMRELGGEWAQAGCTHLKDLFRAACYCLPQAHAARGREELTAFFPGLTEEQLYKIFFWFRPDMLGSCIRYSEGSPFLEQVRAAPVPEGAEKLRAAIPRPAGSNSADQG
ncbi:MAG: DUF2889 domain-containing protein [Deltaproteobacteria bacterium]|nr:DUF2889 domain-containing protein [Deltaproteobacteria bacterium]